MSSRPPDFVTLCESAYPGGQPGPRAALDALWTALFGLPDWLFAVHPGDPTRPYVTEYQGGRWAFVFTDSGQLARFTEQNGLRGPGELLFLSMPTAQARQWLDEAGQRGLIGGAQFNFGGPGWFAPCQNLGAIYEHLMG